MILVDTSIWVDHFRGGDAALTWLLEQRRVLVHPFVVGELALGHTPRGVDVPSTFRRLRPARVATDDEVLHLIAREQLSGSGIGYVDAHLVAATLLTPDAGLWTHDTRLAAVADRLGIGAKLRH